MITPKQILNPQVKPKWQLPVGVMEGIVAYNCSKHGFPRPVLAMPMWEGAGNRAMDLSGHGNHGDLKGATARKGEWLDFNGTTDYVEIPHSDSIDPEYISVSAWFISDRHLSYQGLIRKGNNSGVESYGFIMGYPTTDDIRFSIHDGIWRHGGPVVLIIGKLYHVVGTYDGSHVRLYLNGVEVGTPLAHSGTIGGSTDILNIARRSSGDRYFQGTLKNIAIFNKALSAAQIKFLSDNPYFMFQIPEQLYGFVAAGAIMNQFQKTNIGSDLFNGTIS